MNRRLFCLADGVVIALVLCAAVWFLVWSFTQPSQGLTAVVRQNGEVIESVLLSDAGEGREILPDCEPRVCVRVDADGAWVEWAECPDQLCVRTGKITRAGQSAVCLPARISVTLEGGQEQGFPDAITGSMMLHPRRGRDDPCTHAAKAVREEPNPVGPTGN